MAKIVIQVDIPPPPMAPGQRLMTIPQAHFSFEGHSKETAIAILQAGPLKGLPMRQVTPLC
jgi:hypothetical protein